jgi:hypothetical protein
VFALPPVPFFARKVPIRRSRWDLTKTLILLTKMKAIKGEVKVWVSKGRTNFSP